MIRFAMILFGLFVLSSQAQAEGLTYIHMKRCPPSLRYESYRDYWDKTKTFCFIKDNTTYTYRMNDLGEIKLRENGEWVPSEYLAVLNAQSLTEVAQYKKYYVRFMSTGEPIGGVVPFVAHVFFSWGPGTQTMYVFGELKADKVTITGYSNGESLEGDLRATVNTLKNLLVIFNGLNPNRVGVEQTQAEDQRRARPVQEVITKYRQQRERAPQPRIETPFR